MEQAGIAVERRIKNVLNLAGTTAMRTTLAAAAEDEALKYARTALQHSEWSVDLPTTGVARTAILHAVFYNHMARCLRADKYIEPGE